MNNREIKRAVRKLARKKEYEKIYYEYGPKYFRQYVPEKYKEKDIDKLRGEGKYIDIYTKYGKLDLESKIRAVGKEFDKNLPMKNGAISRRWNTIKGILSTAAITGITTLITTISTPLLGKAIVTDIEINKNKTEYEDLIEKYEQSIEEYAKKFDITKQSDMEIIMRCMKDFREGIQGYGDPKLDIAGYRGLDVMSEDGIGVCRNFAPNVADRLNAINPEYNARLIYLYMESKEFVKNNITDTQIKDDGNKIIKIKGNKEYLYENGELKKYAIKKEDGSINIADYEDGNLVSKTVELENASVKYRYYENKAIREKTIIKENTEMKITFNDENEKSESGQEISEIEYWTREKKNEIEYSKIFLNGKLKKITEDAPEYYKYTCYGEDGTISSEYEADSQKEVTTYYKNGKIYCTKVLQNGDETIIRYDDDGNEISKQTEKSEEENLYIKQKRNKELVIEYTQQWEQEEAMKKVAIEKGIPNHVVVAVDIESDNITLTVDPTNLALGIYKDGKLYWFNEKNQEESNYVVANLDAESEVKGTKAFIEYPMNYIKSFKEPNLSREELEEKYGLDAQNAMIEKIEKQEEDRKKALRERLKIGKNVTYDLSENMVTIYRKLEEQISEEKE